MNKFPVSLLRQLLGCMQDGLSIRVTAQKLGISKSSVSLLSQTAVKRNDFFSRVNAMRPFQRDLRLCRELRWLIYY